MKTTHVALSAVNLTLIMLLSSCSQRTLTGPPRLRVGKDECAACGMLISETRSSGALLVTRDGVREYRLFDDLGCMLDDEHDGLKNATVVERYVHDRTSESWTEASAATFVLADPTSLRTPMGSGIAAFTRSDDAAKVQASTGGRVLKWLELVQERRAWMEERYGKPAHKGG